MERNNVIIVAATAYMIRQFNMPYIDLLNKLGFNVHVACNVDEPGPISKEQVQELKMELQRKDVALHNVPIPRSPVKLLQYYKARRELDNIFAKHHFIICHSHTPTGGVIARSIANKYRNKDLTSIYTAHGFHFYKGSSVLNWLLFFPIEKILARKTDVLITINKEDYQLARRHFKVKNLKYIPGVGIDVKKLSSEIDPLENLAFPKEKVRILSVGELNKNKNHSVVIKALSKMDRSDYIYYIVGTGPLKTKLESLILELKLENNVKLLGYRDDVVNIYKMSDIFVFPSFREGLSVSLMEAMATGLPVICSNIRGNSDLIDVNGGFLFEPGCFSCLKDYITILISDVELRSKMGKYNYEVSKNLDIKKIEQEYLEIYREIKFRK